MGKELEFFTTIPGILISAGVILLLLALIILIAQSRKNKKINQELNNNQNKEVSSVNAVTMAQPEIAPQPEIQQQPEIQTTPEPQIVNQPTMISADNVQNVVNSAPDPLAQPQEMTPQPMETIPLPTQDVVNSQPVVELPISNEPFDASGEVMAPANQVNINNYQEQQVVQPTVQQVVQPEIQTTQPVIQPAITPVVEEVVPVETPQTQPAPTIYGGADPTVVVQPQVIEPQAPTTIYGGANPLDNTQTIPAIPTITPSNENQYQAMDNTTIPVINPLGTEENKQ